MATVSRTYSSTSSSSATKSCPYTSPAYITNKLSVFSAISGDKTTPPGDLTKVVCTFKFTSSYYGSVSITCRLNFEGESQTTSQNVTFSSSAPSQTATFTFSSGTVLSKTINDLKSVSVIPSQKTSGGFYWRVENGSLNTIKATYKAGGNEIKIKDANDDTLTTALIGDTVYFSNYTDLEDTTSVLTLRNAEGTSVTVSSDPANLSTYTLSYSNLSTLLAAQTSQAMTFRLTTTAGSTSTYVDYSFTLSSDAAKAPTFGAFDCKRSSVSTSFNFSTDGTYPFGFVTAAAVNATVCAALVAIGHAPTLTIRYQKSGGSGSTVSWSHTYTAAAPSYSTGSGGVYLSGAMTTTDTYTVTATLSCFGYDPVVMSTTVNKSFAAMHINADGSGVAVGQYSTATSASPKFECAYPAYLQGGIGAPLGLKQHVFLASNKSCASGAFKEILSFTAEENGLFMFVANIRYASNATGRRSTTLIYNDGDSDLFIATDSRMAVSGLNTRVNLSAIKSMSAGDTVRLQAVQNSGSNLNVEGDASGTYTFMDIVRIA